MDKTLNEIQQLETSIDELWDATFKNLTEIKKMTKRLTIIKLTQRLKDEEIKKHGKI